MLANHGGGLLGSCCAAHLTVGRIFSQGNTMVQNENCQGEKLCTHRLLLRGPESVTGRAFDSSGSAFFHGALVGGNFVW